MIYEIHKYVSLDFLYYLHDKSDIVFTIIWIREWGEIFSESDDYQRRRERLWRKDLWQLEYSLTMCK